MKSRKGKHSRWSRHLQREFGSKQIAELIVFTGKISPEFLHKFSEDGPVAETQSAARAREKRERKMRAVKARHMLKSVKYLEKTLRQGRVSADDISVEEHRSLEEYKSGEASSGSPGSAVGADAQRAGEEASGDEESSGAASTSASPPLPSPVAM